MDTMKKLVIAWDLDGTLIDSKHRATDENGEFNLQVWFDKATKENIDKDTLLPLSEVFYEFQKTGYTQIAVTARTMSSADFEYLQKHNMNFELILHRENSKELDHVLKDKKINDFLFAEGRIPFMAFDDKNENLEIFDSYGFRTFNANYMNHKLSASSYKEIAEVKPKDF